MSKYDELVELVKYAKKNNDLYSFLYKNINENNFEINQLPYLKREYIKDGLFNIISKDINSVDLIEETTYGTTEGIPLKICKTRIERINLGRLLWKHRQNINGEAYKRCAHYYYNTSNPNARPLIKASVNRINIDLPAIKSNINDYVDDLRLLINYGVKWLICPPTLAYKLAQISLEYGLFLDLEMVEFLSEYVPKYYKETIEKVFNCSTCIEYGCHETWGIAFSNNNKLETMENIILEQVNDNRFMNGYGLCVVTNLKLKSLPFIRYKLNDLISINNNTLKTYGFRSSDYVKINKMFIHCSFFSNFFECELEDKIYPLEDYQIVYDEYLICLLSSKKCRINLEKACELLMKKIKFFYNINIKVITKKTYFFYTDNLTGKMKGIVKCPDIRTFLRIDDKYAL